MVKRYVPKTELELRKIAKDIKNKNIFTSMHINDDNNISSHVKSVFLPLLFASEEQLQSWNRDNITLVYEYFHKAGPRTEGTYPMFFTMNIANSDDSKKIVKYIHELDDYRRL